MHSVHYLDMQAACRCVVQRNPVALLASTVVLGQAQRQSSQKIVGGVLVLVKNVYLNFLIIQIAYGNLTDEVELRINRIRYDLRL